MTSYDTYPTSNAEQPEKSTLFELEQKYSSIDKLQKRFSEIYGDRDIFYLDGRQKRIRLFEVATADFF